MKFTYRTDKASAPTASGGKGYNPYRSSDGKFGAGAHKARPKNPRAPAAAKPAGSAKTSAGSVTPAAKPHATAAARSAVDKAKKSPTKENIQAAREAVSSARGQTGAHASVDKTTATPKPGGPVDHRAASAASSERAQASMAAAKESSLLANSHAAKGDINAAESHAADAKRHHDEAIKHSDDAIAHAKLSGDEKLHENANFDKEDVALFGGSAVRSAEHAVSEYRAKNPGTAPAASKPAELSDHAKSILEAGHQERKLYEHALRDADFDKAAIHAEKMRNHADAFAKEAPTSALVPWSSGNKLVAAASSAPSRIAEARHEGILPPEKGALKAAEYDHMADKFSAGLSRDQAIAVMAYTAHTDRILNPSLRASGGHVDSTAKLYAGEPERAASRAGLEHDRMFTVAGHPSSKFDTSSHNKDEILVSHEVHNLDSAIKSHKMEKDALVYRTVSDPGGAFTGKLQPGAAFVDHGYVSTSSDRNFINDFYVHSGLSVSGKPYANADRVDFHIHLKAGQNAAPIANEAAGYKGSEREVLLPRSSKFTVTKVVEAGGGRPKEIHMEVAE